jgi:gamma-glutamylputrescine oxidase
MSSTPHPPAMRSPSPWLEEAVEPAPPLQGDRRVDVAVVGGGFTGLGAALALREEGLTVALIERAFAGFGASGRNAGHLTPTIGKDLPSLLRLYGRSRARRFAEAAEAAVAAVEENIRRYAIDCDYHPIGNVIAAVHPSQHPRLERAARAAEQLGLAATYLAPEDVRKRGLPQFVTAGVLEGVGGVLDPGKYVRGLRRAVQQAGVELYEETPLLALDEGPRLLLRTPGGRLRADRALLATNAFSPELGRLLPRRVARINVSLFRTAPLTEAQRDAVGWPGGEGIYTAHEILESYRLTADGRILGGSKYIRYAYGNAPLPDEDARIDAALADVFRERFPQLQGAVERCWSGPIAMTLDFLPAIGAAGRFRNVFYSVGYNGHGVALASFAGRALADWIAGRKGPGSVLIERRGLPLPPEPLRWLAVRGIAGALGALDARLDRRVREGRAGRPD